MAEKALSFRIGAQDDASKVFEKLSRTAKSELGKVEDSLDDTRTAGKRAADALTTTFQQLDGEMTELKGAADMLASALGPELAAKIDSTKAVQEFQRMGLSVDDVKADVDALADALRTADDVQMRHFAGGVDNARTRVDGLRSSADQSRSVLANMTGNVTQDLGQLSGVAGSTGVMIGQIGEYAVDGTIGLKNLALMAGPMAGLAAGVSLATAAMERQERRARSAREQMDDFTKAIREGKDAVDVYREALDATGKLELPSLFGDDEDIAPKIHAAGVSVEQFGTAVQGGETEVRRLIDAMKAAGVGGNELEEISEALWMGMGLYEQSTERAAVVTELLGGAQEDTTDKSAALRDVLEDVRDTLEKEAANAETAARNHKQLAEETIKAEDAARRLDRQWGYLNATLSNQEAYDSLQDSFEDVRRKGIEAYAAAAAGSEDATEKAEEHDDAVRNLTQEVAAYSQEVLGISPQQATDIIARIQRGELDAALADINDLNGRVVTVSVRGNLSGLNAQLRAANGSTISGRGSNSASHTGSVITNAREGRVIGRAGAEQFWSPDNFTEDSGRMYSTEDLGRMEAGGPAAAQVVFAPTINVSAGMGANGQQISRLVLEALAEHVQFNGPGGLRRLLKIAS